MKNKPHATIKVHAIYDATHDRRSTYTLDLTQPKEKLVKKLETMLSVYLDENRVING